jgi:pantoate--beta-alanine ligase
MEIINRRQRIASTVRKLRREQKTIGFVPTMGALHEGHLSLVRAARQRCDVVVVSVFVNPTQFGEADDFEKYPRDLTADAALLTDLGVDLIFAPEEHDIYPEGFSTYVYVDGITDALEGASRPGHFRGVATVVTILLNAIRPDLAFFGQKDAQQVAVIQRLVRDLGFETEVIVMPIVREESGLAMSSRNERLSPEEREKAAIIYHALQSAKRAFRDGTRNPAKLTEIVENTISAEPLAKIDYVAAVDPETLATVEKIDRDPVLLAAAVRFGKVRLIDNVIINKMQ